VVSVKSADQKKEFNFFANFVPSFPENASEPYASGPEIKFLVSRKTSEKRVLFSYDFHATAPDCGATSVGSTLNEWWVWETEDTLKVFDEIQKITRTLKNRWGEFPETAARPATPAPPPVQTHRDNRPVYVVVAPASRGYISASNPAPDLQSLQRYNRGIVSSWTRAACVIIVRRRPSICRK
jgi:hypothetical protein